MYNMQYNYIHVYTYQHIKFHCVELYATITATLIIYTFSLKNKIYEHLISVCSNTVSYVYRKYLKYLKSAFVVATWLCALK